MITAFDIGSLRAATLRARSAGLSEIATRVDGGLIQVVNVTYGPRGAGKVTALTDFIPCSDAIAFINSRIGAAL